MGWDGCHRPKGISSKAFFKKELGESLIDLRVKGNVAYGAYKAKDGHIFAVVILMRYCKDPYFNFMYKVMDDSMEPFNYDCPEVILSQLTEPLNEHAKTWRSHQRGKHYVDKILVCSKAVDANTLCPWMAAGEA